MDRRAFFRRATVGAGATALSIVGSASARSAEPEIDEFALNPKPPRRTAVAATFTPCSFGIEEIEFTVMPPGFVPRAVTSSFEEIVLTLLDDDDDAPLFESDAHAFQHGPLDLWRDVRGKLRCRVDYYSPLSTMQPVSITIYGEIPQE